MSKSKTFYQHGEQERIAFESILPMLKAKLSKEQSLYYYYTHNASSTHFDVLVHIYNNVTGCKISSNIFEVKVRNKHFPDLILEQRKYNSLNKLRKKELEYFKKVNLFYICFTPKSTYLFDLDKVNLNWEVGYMNASFVIDKTNKVAKDVTYLAINEASDMNYIYVEKEKITQQVKDKMLEQKAYKCIFESINKLK